MLFFLLFSGGTQDALEISLSQDLRFLNIRLETLILGSKKFLGHPECPLEKVKRKACPVKLYNSFSEAYQRSTPVPSRIKGKFLAQRNF